MCSMLLLLYFFKFVDKELFASQGFIGKKAILTSTPIARPLCVCPNGFEGDPYSECTKVTSVKSPYLNLHFLSESLKGGDEVQKKKNDPGLFQALGLNCEWMTLPF